MVTIIPRKQWGARFRDGDRSVYGLALSVYIHHSVTRAPAKDATVAQEYAAMRELEEIGHDRFGVGISYNAAIMPSGRIYQGVSWNRRGSHTGGINSTVRGIVFVGNYENDEPTPEQLQSCADLIAYGRNLWWQRNAIVYGHRDQKATACPGKNVYKHLPMFNNAQTVTAPATNTNATKGYNVNKIDLRNVSSNKTTYVRNNKHVDNMQGLLAAAGFKVDIDNVGGPATKNALGEFQAKAKLTKDYVCGPLTWNALIEW